MGKRVGVFKVGPVSYFCTYYHLHKENLTPSPSFFVGFKGLEPKLLKVRPYRSRGLVLLTGDPGNGEVDKTLISIDRNP